MRSIITHIAILLVVTFLSTPSLASDVNFKKASKAIEKKSYQEGIQGFEKIIAEDPNNAGAYYNLGVAYMGEKCFGKAIWAFEKVLNKIPNDAEVSEQLEYAYRELNNDMSYEPRLNSFASGLYGIKSNSWSIIAIFSSFLIALCIIVFKLKDAHSTRRLMMIFGFGFSIIFISSIILAASTNEYQSEMNFGIVTKKSIQTFDNKQELNSTKLIEGERVRLLQKDTSEFIQVESINRDVFFVRIEDIAFI